MVLKRRDLEQLMARVGHENVLWSEADRLVYSTDAGSPPALVDLLLVGNRRADVVVRPQSAEEVQSVVQYCLKRGLPMTPRAAATSAVGGAVPKRGGVVIDLTNFRSRIEIDEETLTATCDPGVVVWDLQQKLLEVGLELPTYPTSGLASTIGGFVAMDGHGIHSTRHGNIGRHVVDVEGVGMDGHRFALRDRDERDMLVGLAGSTGIITRVRLRVVEAQPDKPVVITVSGHAAIQQAVEEIRTRFPVKHIMFHNSDFFALRAEATGQRKATFGGKDAVIACFAEKDFNKAKDDLERLAKRLGGALVEGKEADAEWAARFYPIRAKRLGPSIVAGEVFVPVQNLRRYLDRLRSRATTFAGGAELSVEGHVTDDGRIYFFIFTPDDERRASYPLGWATSAWILSLAKRMGGTAYHSGVWLQWESKSIYGTSRYRRLKALKRQGDPRNLMNPGTVFPLAAPIPERLRWAERLAPIPIAPSLGFQLWAGNPVLMSQGGAMRYRRKKSLGVQAADVAADMARSPEMGIHSPDIWGADIPTLQAIPNPAGLPMTQTVRGKMVLAKAYVQSRVNDPWTLKPVLDVADPSPEEAAVVPDYERVQKVLDAFRRAVASEGVELEVKAVEVKEQVVEAAADSGTAKGKEGLDIEAIKKQAAETPEPEKAWVLAVDCIVCNGCESACPTNAAIVTDIARVDRDLCIADGACFDACPTDAIRPGIEEEDKSAGWPAGSRLAGKFGVPVS